MLRILRKIKHGKPIEESSRTFWRFAIAEFFLVFLGILIALQVDNWNQDRKDRKLEKVLLNEMLLNLRSDLEDVEYNINYHNRFLVSGEIVLAFIDGEEPYHDSLDTHFGHLNGGTAFMENISAYESLKSIGIDLIRNDSLRQKITYLYAVTYDYIMTVAQFAQAHVTESWNPSISEHIFIIKYFDKAVPLDVSAMRQSNVFRHHLTLNNALMEYHILSYNTAKLQIIKLISEIEMELS